MGGPDWNALLRGEVMLTDLLSLISKEGNNHLPPKHVQPGTFCPPGTSRRVRDYLDTAAGEKSAL